MQHSAQKYRGKAPVDMARWLLVLLAIVDAPGAAAQSTRDVISGARLGAVYSQILNLTATPDISSAHLNVTDGGDSQSLFVTRVPLEGNLFSLSDRNTVNWRISGGYFRQKDTVATNVPGGAPGSIDSKWSAYSATGGLFLSSKLGYGFTFEPGIDFSLARLLNDASYAGTATSLQPLTDGPLFNWHENAWLITPNAALAWTTNITPAQTLSVRGHIAWSWVSSFGESDPILRFRETAGSWSIEADYAGPTGAQLFARPLGYVVSAGYGGFFGPDRDALGFTSIAKVGAGLEVPLSRDNLQSKRVRVGAAYLFGAHVSGWTVNLGLDY